MNKIILVLLCFCSSIVHAQYINNYPVSRKTYADFTKLNADWQALQASLQKDAQFPELLDLAKSNVMISGFILSMLTIELRHLDKGQMSNGAIAQIKTYVARTPDLFKAQSEKIAKIQVDSKDGKIMEYIKKFNACIDRSLKQISIIDADLNLNFE